VTSRRCGLYVKTWRYPQNRKYIRLNYDACRRLEDLWTFIHVDGCWLVSFRCGRRWLVVFRSGNMTSFSASSQSSAALCQSLDSLWQSSSTPSSGSMRYTYIIIIDKTVAEWRKKLGACVAEGGGQFVHKMWTFIISDILYRLSEFSDPTFWNIAVLFSKNWLFCWVQCVLCATLCNCNYITLYKEYL